MFITKEDLNTKIRELRLNQITDADDTIVTGSIREALDTIRSALSGPGYNMNLVLAQVGDQRNGLLMGWAKNLAMYAIYDRIPDEDVPDRVIKNYEDTWALLMKASAGQLSLDLPRSIDSSGRKKTKFRAGGDKPRSTYP